MQTHLKQAIAAARTGKKKEAQILLTKILEKDPHQVQAWYLLSLLVDSESKQHAYLQKVMALDPTHEKARARLVELEIAEPVVALADESSAYADSAEMETADTMPDWLFDEMEAQPEESVAVKSAPEDLPDWLRENAPPEVEHEEALTPVTEIPTLVSVSEPTAESSLAETVVDEERPSAAPPAPPIVTSTDKKNHTAIDRQLTRLNQLLAFLVICAAILFILLLYFLLTGFFS